MKIYVAARARTLRPDVLGGALGIISAGIVLLASLVALVSGETVRLVDVFLTIFPWYSISLPGILIGIFWGFLLGLLLGLLIGNIFTLLIRHKSRNSKIQVLEIDPGKVVNVVQRGDPGSSQPYTVAIVANPLIYLATYAVTEEAISQFPDATIRTVLGNLKRHIEANFLDAEVVGHSTYINLLYDFFSEDQLVVFGRDIVEKTERYRGEGGKLRSTFSDDPLMNREKNFGLFAQGASRVLRAFAANELLGLPKILGPMRIVLIYDDHQKDPALLQENALCESLEPAAGSESPIVDILAPRLKTETVRSYVRTRLEESIGESGPASDPDVVIVLSASNELTRSAATFSVEDHSAEGCKFRITDDDGNMVSRKHAFVASQPGVAAISIWDDRLKTPVHEFAHAMSSYQNGPIVDEYIDGQGEYFEFRVNKKFLPSMGMSVPQKFASYGLWNGSDYQLADYTSDRQNRDKPEDWRSYSASRSAGPDACIMDIAHHGYRYDNLLFDFMYDRLMAKLRRDVAEPCQLVSSPNMAKAARADAIARDVETAEIMNDGDHGREQK